MNGEGKDGGVVFNEMKGRLSDPWWILRNEADQLLYPGRCGYKSETGGQLKNLRTETNIKKIRKFHAKFYRLDNMVIIVSGHVEKEALFKAIEPVEKEEEAKKRDEFKRPFQTPCPDLSSGPIKKEVEYPDGIHRWKTAFSVSSVHSQRSPSSLFIPPSVRWSHMG